jgi:CHC2 zinc finger
MEVKWMITDSTQERSPRYAGRSYRRPIDEAKRLVPVPDLAEKLSGAPGVRRGRELVFICPLHDDHNPSLRVDPDKGVWFCNPCLVGGDVVELARLAWGYVEVEAHTAAAMLLMEFGHEVPQRPPSWFRKQERQRAMRGVIEDARVEVMTRRLWRWIFEPIVAEIEEPTERLEMADELWGRVVPLAAKLLKDRDARRAA